MNRSGKGFLDVAFLLGVADQFDSRSAVSADIDRDGRVDLLVTEHLGTDGEKLHIYRNVLDTGNAWIGVELREQGNGRSPVGASVVVHASGRTHIGRIVTGETLMGQHATTLHFGLGDTDHVDSIEVRWPNGAKRTLHAPSPGRYHLVSAPSGTGVPEVLDASLNVPVEVPGPQEIRDEILADLPRISGNRDPGER